MSFLLKMSEGKELQIQTGQNRTKQDKCMAAIALT